MPFIHIIAAVHHRFWMPAPEYLMLKPNHNEIMFSHERNVSNSLFFDLIIKCLMNVAIVCENYVQGVLILHNDEN